jgi:hypothetical protein
MDHLAGAERGFSPTPWTCRLIGTDLHDDIAGGAPMLLHPQLLSDAERFQIGLTADVPG